MRKEVINKLLQGSDEDVILAMHWIFKNMDVSRKRTSYFRQYPVGDRKSKNTITLYSDKYILNTGRFYLVFSKRGYSHYRVMLTQTHDTIIKIEDDI